MLRNSVTTVALLISCGGALAAEFDPGTHHDKFIEAFNNREWEGVKSMLADDSVFHRADATEVYGGQDAIVDHFEQTIGGEWNVKFARLDSTDQFTGNDGGVVERGDFAITAGADDSACYAGSYMMTWAPANGGDDWKLKILSWQDLETSLENCK